MKKLILVVILSVLFAIGARTACAQNPVGAQTITLKDGSVLKGQLMGVNGDTYTIQTPTMGSINVKASTIQSINAAGSAPTSSPSANTPVTLPSLGAAGDGKLQQLQSVSQGLLADPNISESVQQILKDPALMNMIQNPQFLSQVLSADPQQVKDNPEIQKFMQDPKVQDMMNKIMQKMSTSPGSFQGLIPAQK